MAMLCIILKCKIKFSDNNQLFNEKNIDVSPKFVALSEKI